MPSNGSNSITPPTCTNRKHFSSFFLLLFLFSLPRCCVCVLCMHILYILNDVMANVLGKVWDCIESTIYYRCVEFSFFLHRILTVFFFCFPLCTRTVCISQQRENREKIFTFHGTSFCFYTVDLSFVWNKIFCANTSIASFA